MEDIDEGVLDDFFSFGGKNYVTIETSQYRLNGVVLFSGRLGTP